MSPLKSLKIGTKISIGFGVILALLFISILFELFGLRRLNENFYEYRKISTQEMLTGRIQANLLESRLAAKNYIQTGDENQRDTFEKRYGKMENFITELETDMENSERTRKVEYIIERSREFKEDFEQIIEYSRKKDEVYDRLLKKGPELENDLSEIMDSAHTFKNEELTYSMASLRRHFLLARFYVSRFLETNELQWVDKGSQEIIEMEKWLKHIEGLGYTFIEEEQIQKIKKEKEVYYRDFMEISSIIKIRNEIIQHQETVGVQISAAAEEIKLSIIEDQKTYGPKMEKGIQWIMIQMAALAILALILSIVISIGIIQMVAFPIKTVTNTFKDIAQGEENLEVRLEVNSKDELGEMAIYFNRFMEKLNFIMRYNKNQSWLKAGQTALSEKISGEQTVEELSNNIISHICKYLNVYIGAIYVENENQAYELMGSYGLNTEEILSKKIKSGHGLIGQAIVDKEVIVLSRIPKDYMKIHSALGEGNLKNIVVVPCAYHDEVKCVLELGNFEEFTEIQKEFLDAVRESIAIGLYSVESKEKMKALLEKTIMQSEELQLQQEELRQSNEELEEQTKALKESESRLQTQQEELKVINEELKEYNINLELQKQDIDTKNKNLINVQKEIEEKAKDLEIANKYKSEFLANVSHELRTPLNSILVLSQILAEKKDNEALTDKQRGFASTIYNSGSELLRLINDILDLAKVEAGKMEIHFETMNIYELIENMEKSFDQIAKNKNIDFILEVEKGLPQYIYTDSHRIQQIMNNLLSNAFKFTDQGKVTLKVYKPENEILMKDNIDIKNTIAISVSDTGVGIPQDKQSIIFEPFRQSDGTTSRKYGGTGLGLSITKELIKLLGGEINLQSETGKGSIFTFTIPIFPEEKIEWQEVSVSKEVEEAEIMEKDTLILEIEKNQRDRKEEKLILVIEDDADFANILLEISRKKGYRCIFASTGEKAIDLAIKNVPDAILLDIGLPDTDGWEVIKKLNSIEKTKNIPVHVISGKDLEGIGEIRKEIVGFVQKPASMEEIENVFGEIQEVISDQLKKLLIVGLKEEENKLMEVLGNKEIKIIFIETGIEAIQLLQKEKFDCVVLDLNLKDGSGFDFLTKCKNEEISNTPIIIYTEKNITREEDIKLQRFSDTIIIKGRHSMERLASEVNLFLQGLHLESKEENKEVLLTKEKEDFFMDRKILVVDDDMRNVFSIHNLLEQEGMKVIVSKDGQDAMEKLEIHEDIDLILMDIMMPEMDGYTAMRQIKSNEKTAHIPIIALTAKSMKEERQKCIEAGANDYLTKPIEMHRLISILRVWLFR